MKRSQRIELQIKQRLITELEKTELDREREKTRSMRRAFEQEKLALMRELESVRNQVAENNDRERNQAVQEFLSHSLSEKTDAYLQEIAQIAANTRAIADVSTALYGRLKLIDHQLAINIPPDAPPALRPARKRVG